MSEPRRLGPAEKARMRPAELIPRLEEELRDLKAERRVLQEALEEANAARRSRRDIVVEHVEKGIHLRGLKDELDWLRFRVGRRPAGPGETDPPAKPAA